MRSTSNSINLKNKFKTVLLLTLAAIVAVSSAGCFRGGLIEEQEAAVAANAAAKPVETQAAKTLPAEGGVLNIPMPLNPQTLNPLKVRNMELSNIYSLIFESLVEIDLSGRPQPSLAETWETSEDGKTWTFHLRKGIKYHKDLKDMTASDVVFTLDMLKSIPAAESVYSKCNSIITSYEATDDSTLKITTSTPKSAVLFNMVFPILSEEYYENAAGLDEKLPVGSGPYKLDSFEVEKGMVLSVNQNWWKTKPFITTINAIPMEDNAEELAAYEQLGTLDMVPTAIQTAGKYRVEGKTNVLDFMTQFYDCLVPNINKTLFSDPNVRKALAFSIDKGDIISKALLNHAVAADFPVPPDSWLYDGKLKIYEYNTAKAQELLEASGWKDMDNDGFREKMENGTLTELACDLLVLKTDDITYKKDVADQLVDQLKVMGFNIKVVEKTWDQYKPALEKGDYQLALCSYYLDRYPDLNFILGSNGAENYSGFASAEMDAALNACATTVKEEDMPKVYGALQQLFVNELPHIALYFRTNSLVYRSSIKGLEKVRELDVYHDIAKWYIATKNVE